ncbi:MAG: cation-translocating P-type ATPase [Lachnospiraceae bacterium]|nr:cation-translocating P-type ATPase [Lachnospiraceae bacterium]
MSKKGTKTNKKPENSGTNTNKTSTENVKGLTTEEALERAKEGRNVLTQGKKKSIFSMILEQFASPLLLLLIAAAVISIANKELVDGIIIIVVVLANVIIGTVQEVSAEKSVEALKQINASTAIVIRDGKQKEIPAADLVVGDYVILEAGRVIPADLALTDTSSLKINESALTGESVAVEKDSREKSNDKTPLGDRKDKAFMSTLVEYGRGEGVVEKIGDNTEIGKISSMLHKITKQETPLQKNLNSISLVLGIAGVVLCLLMVVCQYFVYKTDIIETLMISIAFAVAVIPEGLATVVTLVLSSGIQKMSKRNAIVKQIHAVETLGAVNVICSDKTGTLTQNKMTVVRWYFLGEEVDSADIELNNPIFSHLLTGFLACNDAKYSSKTGEEIGDPTETAFIKYAKDNKLGYDSIMEGITRFDEIPFDSDRKMMTTLDKVEKNGETKNVSFTKGAIDSVIVRCDRILDENGVRKITTEDILNASKSAEKMSSEALRVLALAYREGDTEPQEKDMIFVGLSAMIDPPKEGVKETVYECHNAGIDVAMITGDHKITAFAIAKELDIANDISQCISGAEIDEMDPEEFKKTVLNYRVFARVSPENKVQIVQAFQSHGKICSMTGDGVNDAPSLKAADIGVAMGIGGTEVAKDAAEMILVDDNFITIKNAVMEGRNLFNNIKKSVVYLLRSNFGEVVLMASAIFAGFSSPLSTIQILWVNLLTDTAPSLALGMDVGSDSVMNEKPRDVKAGILDKGDYINIVIQGLISGCAALLAFLLPVIVKYGAGDILGHLGKDAELLRLCRTYCFSTLAINEMLMAYVCKTTGRLAFFTKESWNNKALNIITVAGILLQIGVLAIAPLSKLLKLAPVSVGDVGVIFFIAVSGVMINAAITLAKERLQIKKDRNI